MDTDCGVPAFFDACREQSKRELTRTSRTFGTGFLRPDPQVCTLMSIRDRPVAI